MVSLILEMGRQNTHAAERRKNPGNDFVASSEKHFKEQSGECFPVPITNRVLRISWSCTTKVLHYMEWEKYSFAQISENFFFLKHHQGYHFPKPKAISCPMAIQKEHTKMKRDFNTVSLSELSVKKTLQRMMKTA